MTDKLQAPQFYGEPQMGEQARVSHEAGREARLAAAGIAPATLLTDFQREKAEMVQHSIQGLGAKVEPVTEKSVIGHSPEKKEALKLMKDEDIPFPEALERVKAKANKSRKTGKGK